MFLLRLNPAVQVHAATEYQTQQKKIQDRKAKNEELIRQGLKPKPEIVTEKDTFDENTMQERQSRTSEQNEGIDHYIMQVTAYIGPYFIQGPSRRATQRYNTCTSAHLSNELVAQTVELYKRRLFYLSDDSMLSHHGCRVSASSL